MLVEKQQHLELPRREARGERLRNDVRAARSLADLLHQPARDRAGERSLAVRDAAEEVDDALRRLVLQQVAGRAQPDRAQEVRVVLGCGQDDDRRVGGGLADPRERREAVHPRHRQIEDDQVGAQRTRLLDRLGAVGRLPDDVEPARREEPRERFARERMVVGDEDWRLGEDLDRWLALGATLTLFASLEVLFEPVVAMRYVTQGDFLLLLGYAVLVVGVGRGMLASELGRAVAEERARVAREIHDGLAQYLFAISTHATMLQAGADVAETVPKLKQATHAAQAEARFATLALSSAAGSAPFDVALRRYVDFLTADGELEVELEIDSSMRLAPDEQIEVFRIVQEGLGNTRKHAHARRAWVTIGRRGAERLVAIRDDGSGFVPPEGGATQGLSNIRARAATIGGALSLRTTPGAGTSLEVVLRA